MPNTFEMDDAASSSPIVTTTEVFSELGVSSPTDDETAVMTGSVARGIGAVIRTLRYDPSLRVRTEYYPRMDFVSGNRGVWEVGTDKAYFRSLSEAAIDELQVDHLPIRESGATGTDPIDLRIDYDGRFGTRTGSFATDTKKTEGDDFWPDYGTVDSAGRRVCRDGIIRSEGTWPQQAGSVKIVYAAGYTISELKGDDNSIDASPIYEAVMDEVVRRFQRGMSRLKTKAGFLTPLSSEHLGSYSYRQNADLMRELLGSRNDVTRETALKLESFINFGALMAT